MNHSRTARDLVWSIRQQPLVLGNAYPTAEWFRSQTVETEQLPQEPPEHFRLGIHFEKLYQHWLQHHPEFELLAANLQVQGETRTLGEFDLLAKSNNVAEHWELAVKFYINFQNSENPSMWFGPDPNDTLAGKIERLENHQLGLSNTNEARALLNHRGIKLDRTRGVVKGRLYHPWQKKVSPPDIVNPEHLSGWWLAEEDLKELRGYSAAYLSKKYWLSEITPDDALSPMTFEALEEFIKTTKQIAPQFGLLDGDGAEISRGFVLKPQWFERARLAANQS